jgi:hypothetical protein
LKTHGISGLRFIVLIPHRDGGRPLRALRRDLFAAGFAGAFSFPPAAPAALVSRPFTSPELRSLAFTLREASLRDGRDGTIAAGDPAPCPAGGTGPAGFALYGPVLDLPLPDLPREGVLFRFPFLTLCAALIPGGSPEEARLGNPGDAGVRGAPFKPFSFRAAAVANMILSPLRSGEPGYSYQWQIGNPRWLPSPKRARSPRGGM